MSQVSKRTHGLRRPRREYAASWSNHTPARVFAAPVLTDMAKCIYGAPAYPSDKAIAVRTEGHQAPLFFLPSGFGDYSYVYELARFIDNESPIYALPWPAGLAEKGSLWRRWSGMPWLCSVGFSHTGLFIGRAFSLVYSQTSAGEWREDRLCWPDR